MKIRDSGFFNLLIELVKKDIRLRYKRSLLGLGWSLANPILMMLVFSLIFSRFPRLTGMELPYHIYFLTGYLPWVFFSSTCHGGKDSIVANGGIVRQVSFDRAVLPLSTMIANFIHFVLALGLLVIYIFIHPDVYISSSVFLLPFLLLLNGIFLFGLIQLLSALNVFFRDVGQILDVALTFLFYLTPVFYSFSLFTKEDSWIVLILKINPMSHFVILYRGLLLKSAQAPFESWCFVLLWTFLAWRIGGRVFTNKQGIFAKEL